jgi:glycosyltransferase involved in cell wall biosynthesis|tara:strand:- start:2304 stop:3017 length:714 start_codon:yes stop_codon:yes gene_type:complete
LQESINSALSQTFTDFEFIIINDGSTDSSKDIVLSYKDDRIVFIDNTDNKKIPTRRNEAIDIAKGKYIAIHDGDDVSLNDRFEKQINLLESEDLFCVGGFADKIDTEGNELELMDYPPETNYKIINKAFVGCRNPMIDPTTMFRRDDFLLLGGYTLDTIIYTVPDFDLWIRAILTRKKFHNIQEALIKYRFNPDGMTLKHKKEMIKAHMVVWYKFVRQLTPLLNDKQFRIYAEIDNE